MPGELEQGWTDLCRTLSEAYDLTDSEKKTMQNVYYAGAGRAIQIYGEVIRAGAADKANRVEGQTRITALEKESIAFWSGKRGNRYEPI